MGCGQLSFPFSSWEPGESSSASPRTSTGGGEGLGGTHSPKIPLRGPGAYGKPPKKRCEKPAGNAAEPPHSQPHSPTHFTPLSHSEIPARPGPGGSSGVSRPAVPPRRFGDEQRFIARQESSALSLLILSLPPRRFRAPEGRARPCGTTNTNILPQRGFSTPALPAASQHIPLSPGSFPAPSPQLPHSRGARRAPERSLPSPASPGPGGQCSPQGSIPQKLPAPARSRCPQSAPGAHKCAFSEPRSKGDILARQAFPSYFWERLGESWGRNGGRKNPFWVW